MVFHISSSPLTSTVSAFGASRYYLDVLQHPCEGPPVSGDVPDGRPSRRETGDRTSTEPERSCGRRIRHGCEPYALASHDHDGQQRPRPIRGSQGTDTASCRRTPQHSPHSREQQWKRCTNSGDETVTCLMTWPHSPWPTTLRTGRRHRLRGRACRRRRTCRGRSASSPTARANQCCSRSGMCGWSRRR